jgi:heme-degrading monooxygenase HmoA
MDSDLFAESQNESKLLPGQLPCSNYLASNRFKVRNGKIAAFDKRWADRTSRLAELNGFKFFSLLRRVEEFGITYDEKNDKYNYLSFTIWENKENFNEWRTGEAFKEAHGNLLLIF